MSNLDFCLMRKVLILPPFFLLSAALSCPVKTGYVANGMFKTPQGLVPECGVLYDIVKKDAPSSGVKWVEFYRMAPSKTQAINDEVAKKFSKKGYRYLKSEDVKESGIKGRIFMFVNVATQQFISTNTLIMDGDTYFEIFGQ